MFKDLGPKNQRIMLALVIWGLGEGLWLNLRQLYLAELGAAPDQVGVALAVEGIMRAVLPIPAGYLADRAGPYRLMVLSWALGTVGPALMALAPDWRLVIPGMVIYGMSAFAVPAMNSYVLLSLPDQSLPGIGDRAVTSVFASFYTGLIISPWIGGVIANATSIQVSLWVGLALFVISTLVMLTAGGVAPPALESRGQPRRLLHNRLFIGISIYYMFALFSVQVGFPLAPNFVHEVRGFSLADIGLLLSIMSIGTVLLSVGLGRANPRWNFAAALGVAWLALVGLWSLSNFAGVAVAFLALGGVAVTRTLGTAGIARVVGPQNRALAFGVFETLSSMQIALAAWAAGGLYSLTPTHTLPFIAGIILAPLAITIWFAARLGQASTAPTLMSVPEPTTPGD